MPLTKYKVGDLIIDAAKIKVLMILESPHVNEYIHSHPAAGESALALTQFLKSQGYLSDFNPQLPVGCNIKRLHYKPLGILNCSHLPMNPTFYPCLLADDERLSVNRLVAIKQSLAHNKDDALTALIKSDLFKDFVSRLNQVLAQVADAVIIIPCGHTARGFINAYASTYPKSLNILYGLPHPTESDWHDKINTISLVDHIPQQLLA